jgi:hypothetical protein
MEIVRNVMSDPDWVGVALKDQEEWVDVPKSFGFGWILYSALVTEWRCCEYVKLMRFELIAGLAEANIWGNL